MKRYIIPLIIGCLFIGIGSAVSAVNLLDFGYINNISSEYTPKVETINETIGEGQFIISSDWAKIENISNNDIEPGNIEIKISYYNKFADLDKELMATNNTKELEINIMGKVRTTDSVKEFAKMVIEDLRDKEVYNYSLFFRPTITVSHNDVDSNKIEIINRNYNW